jgi:hypothetical protein
MQIKQCSSCNYTKPIEEFIKTSSYCKECRSKYYKSWHGANRPRKPVLSIEQLKLKKEKQRKKIREYIRNKRATDIKYRIACTVRSRIQMAFRNSIKNSSSWSLIGCDQQSYIKYLESLFKEGMSWDNYGTYWEIDHIVPCSHFDLTECEQQKKCFHYTNTQPSVKSVNRSKNNRYIG